MSVLVRRRRRRWGGAVLTERQNHIVHHLLSLYALASSASNIQRRYEDNKSYQRPAREPDARVVDQLHDPAFYQKCLGDGQHYNDFLAFFQGEMEQKGWEAVLNEYLFSGDERAEDMLVRMFMGPSSVRRRGGPPGGPAARMTSDRLMSEVPRHCAPPHPPGLWPGV